MDTKSDIFEIGIIVVVALIFQVLWNISFSIFKMTFESLTIMMISLLTAIVVVRTKRD